MSHLLRSSYLNEKTDSKVMFSLQGREEEHVRDEVASIIWAVLLDSLCGESSLLAVTLRRR